jgi:purine nucleoside permease
MKMDPALCPLEPDPLVVHCSRRRAPRAAAIPRRRGFYHKPNRLQAIRHIGEIVADHSATFAELSRESGQTVTTLRRWEELGLLETFSGWTIVTTAAGYSRRVFRKLIIGVNLDALESEEI